MAKAVKTRILAKDGRGMDERLHAWCDAIHDKDQEALRWMCRNDLFLLLTCGLGRRDAINQWVCARCDEVQDNPDGTVFIWAREHYKSSIITFAATIQEILRTPEITVGIFSHTRPIAKQFLAQIMREFEGNQTLRALFPAILFEDPRKSSAKWSMDDGIIVKRKGNPKESTVEAWGLVDGQPTSKHFDLVVYDDIVTAESVTTPEQIAKTTERWELSLNLATRAGRRRYVGTRYHQLDTWGEIIKRGLLASIRPATEDGTPEGKPVLLSSKSLDDKRALMGPYTFACQLLCSPIAADNQGFKKDWLAFYLSRTPMSNQNIYIVVDPAGSKKKKSNDFTVMLVIGLACDGNYYLRDGVRDRMNLEERTKTLFRLVQKWQPRNVGYEEYGLQADIEHILYVQNQNNYHFSVTPLGGGVAKQERISKLVPVFSDHRMWFPAAPIQFINTEGKACDLVKTLLDEEFEMYPVSAHDDMLDCMARILDPVLGATFPQITQDVELVLGMGNGSREYTQMVDDFDYLRGRPKDHVYA